MMKPTRREFLQRSGALTAAGLARRMAPLPLLGLAGQASAQAAEDYKALVCVFLFGGVDGNNLVVPGDTAGYGQYAAVRPESSGVALTRAELLAIQPRGAPVPYGLHPELSEIHPLFEQGRMAIVANVGTLNEPTTKANYLAARPDNLFSHSDQQNQWQSSVSDGPSRSGWGGRIADQLAGANAGNFPVATSIAGASLFIAGNATSPLALPQSGALSLQGFGSAAPAQARLAALQAILAADRDNAYVKATGDITTQAIALSSVVNPILSASSAIQPLFAGQASGIAQQLLVVAKLIEARAQTGARRQVFFVSQGGYDTHSNELTVMGNLLGQLSPALRAFNDAMAQLGVSSQVTAFTLSDFGRTFQPASGAGTDHAWGNHHFVMGGAVRGGQMYGRYPTLARAGPDDADTSGRWIPTTSVEQYGATLARWFGVSEAGLQAIFPNLSKFSTPDLGFMG